jgi:hypothetical protein
MTAILGVMGAVTATSVAGSLHCAAMCGPLVGLYRDPHAHGRAAIAQHAAYALGRGSAYVGLGVLAGAVGGAVDLAGRMFDVQRIAWMVAAAAVIGWGLITMAAALGIGGARVRATGGSPLFQIGRSKRRGVSRAAMVGLLSAALPCGWLWAFVVLAAGSGGPITGGLIMLAFWAGTVPMTLGAGAIIAPLARRLGRRWPLVSASALIVLGSVALVMRAPTLAPTAIGAGATAIPDHPSCHGH